MTADRHRGAGAIAVAALAVILLTTLRASPAQVERAAETSWRCLVCGDAGVTDVLLNLLLFWPLGAALRALWWPWWRAIGAMALGTLAIEGAQATLLAGRDASLGDVLANTLGGAFGWCLLPTLALLRSPNRTRARSMTAALILASSATWLMTGWGLHPYGSTSAPWVGQRMRQWTGHDLFPGALGVATLNDIEIPNDQLDETPAIADTVHLSLLLMRRDSATPSLPVSILRVVDGRGREQFSVAQQKEWLLFGARVRASRLRVRTPVWRIEGAARMPTDVPWLVEWRWLGSRVELWRGPASGITPPTVDSIPLSIGLGWVFVHPLGARVDSGALWWTALWLALWCLPIGWCLGWLARWEMLPWGVSIVLSFIGASLLTHLPVRPLEIAMLVGWLIAGWLSAAAAGSRRTP